MRPKDIENPEDLKGLNNHKILKIPKNLKNVKNVKNRKNLKKRPTLKNAKNAKHVKNVKNVKPFTTFRMLGFCRFQSSLTPLVADVFCPMAFSRHPHTPQWRLPSMRPCLAASRGSTVSGCTTPYRPSDG